MWAAGQTLPRAGEITHSPHCCTINDNGVHPDLARSQQATGEIHKPLYVDGVASGSTKKLHVLARVPSDPPRLICSLGRAGSA